MTGYVIGDLIVNRLVAIALGRFVARRKARAFLKAIAEMSADVAIQAENAAISREFLAAETDGLAKH